VALVERGNADTNRWIHIPATFFKAWETEVDTVASEPDPTLNGLRFAVPQGKVIGGGSSINGMIYMRGQKQDYDDWETEHGCTGWNYDSVLETFRKQEQNKDLDDAYHGTEGKLIVAEAGSKHPVSGAIIDAAVNAGVERTGDFNGAKQDGAGWYQLTAHGGQRQSAAQCFLKPELRRENLTVLTGHVAGRVVIENRRARAIECREKDGSPLLIRANREIVLTAGSFHSPKILMLSGIGPRDVLEKHGITVIHESDEVGRNYQDHVGAPVTRRLKRPIGLFGADKGLRAVKHGIDYWVFRRGLLASSPLQAGACVDTDGSGRPDVQYNFAPFAPGAPATAPLAFHAIQVHPMTMRPKSRGRLGLKSTDPSDAPHFETRILEHLEDMAVLRRGVRLAREICEQAPLKELLGDEVWPGPDVSTAQGSNSIDDAIRAQARTIFHPAGTCRMGPTEASVVGLDLKVHGIEGLRVADCSIMPALVSGNTNAPTMMIADRCADAILAEASG
jgi:choline dehydrogenase-like flavoprotein